MTLDQCAELTAQERKLVDLLKGKSRSEQDQILYEYERNLKNGNTLRINNTGKRLV